MTDTALFALGLNYRTAPVAVRERVAFPATEQRAALEALKRATVASEAALVSTCNRTELYLRGTHEVLDRAVGWIAGLPSVSALDLRPHLYRLVGAEVPRHAFRVTSGLDSMILGEPQVLGQVKHAIKIATDANTLSGPLDRLFQESFQVAKTVRSRTAIGTTSISMTAAAVKLAAQLFADMHDVRVLLVGSGEMIQLAAAHFAAASPREIVVANRTSAKAHAVLAGINPLVPSRTIGLDQLSSDIHQFDIVVSSTASSLPVIGKGMIERAVQLRRQRPMFLLDLAVPRDIEAEVANIDDVYLHTLDSLGRIIEQNLGRRQAAVAEADAIIEAHTSAFMAWLEQRRAVPTIQRLRERADGLRQHELARAQQQLARGEDAQRVIEQLAHSLTNKLLHHPTQALRTTGDPALVEALTRAFQLGD